jgi:hypothetical protein
LADIFQLELNSLLQDIRQYIPDYEYPAFRPPGSRASEAEVRELRDILRQVEASRSCSRYPRGPGASRGPIPPGYKTVSRWVSEKEILEWLENQGTAIPGGVGAGGRVYVTDYGAPQPGGTGPYRIDFAVPASALSPGGNPGWYQIFQPFQSTPIYNVVINAPVGGKWGSLFMGENAVAATNEYGLVVRRRALLEKGVEYESLLKALEAQKPLDHNDELITFGPSFGAEAMNEFMARLQYLGLTYVDDFYCLSFDLPPWCGLRLVFRNGRNP